MMYNQNPEYYEGMQSQYDVYLAGPFFNSEQKATMAIARDMLRKRSLFVCDPQELSPVIKDSSEKLDTRRIFVRNVAGVARSDVILACIDDRDSGTAWELGYAYARWGLFGRPHLFTFSGKGHGANVMLAHASFAHFPSLQAVQHFCDHYQAYLISATTNKPLQQCTYFNHTGKIDE